MPVFTVIIILAAIAGCGRDPMNSAERAWRSGDFHRAVAIWQHVAPQNMDARRRLAQAYLIGKGCTKDEAKARMLFESLAEKEDATAFISLGYMYYQGRGVAPNWEEALKWYILAAAHGKPQPIAQILPRHMTKSQVSHAQVAAREWQHKHP